MGLFMLFLLGAVFTITIIAAGIAQTILLSLNSLSLYRMDILKLTMAPGFIMAAFLCGLISIRFLPRRGSLSSSPLLALAVLPVVLQILAIPLHNLSLWLFPPGELYFSLVETLKPTGHPLDTLGAIVSIVLIGPLCEEFVFRGVMMERALREGRNLHVIVLLQGLLFGLAHMNPWQFFYAWAFGTLFGYLRYWTGGIALTTLLHMLVNGWSVLAMYVSMPGFPNTDDGRPVPVNWWLILAALALGAAVVFAIRQRPSRT